MKIPANSFVFAIAAAFAFSAVADDASPAVDDRAVLASVQRYSEKEVADGHATKVAELISQLDRRSCGLKAAPAGTSPVALTDLAKQGRAAVGVVGALYKCPKCSNWHVSTASGFFISGDGAFVTCYHVINSPDREMLSVLTGDGKLTSIRSVLAADPAADVAIVQCEGSGFATVPLCADAPAGAPITVLSHPDNRFFTLTQGIISRYFIDGRKVRTEMFSITADFAKGSSGAPVFDGRGNVVGMVTNTQSVYYDEKDGHAENLQMVFKNCVTAKSILRLLKPAGT
jgi:S1-C subfamily serine protease